MDFIPYPGLRPFNYKEASIFFGREQQTELLLKELSHARFVSIIGPSGCGKSSLVQAGMIAALKDGNFLDTESKWWVGMMRPGENPMPNLAAALQRKSLLEENRAETFEEEVVINQLVLSCLRRNPLGLVEVLRENPLPKNTNLLLLVDQFEDILRFYGPKSRDEMKAFVALLIASVQQSEFPVYVVIIIRSEYLGDCVLFRGLPEIMNVSQFIVPRLSLEQLRKAIIEPARMFAGEVEPRLVKKLLEEMEDEPDQLPLLQHCLIRTWLRAKSRGSLNGRSQNASKSPSLHTPTILMTLDDYTAVGGFKNALPNHADETFRKLNESQQQIAERMFRRLGDQRVDRGLMNTSAKISEIATIAEVPVADVMKIVEIFRHPERCFLSPEAEVPLTPDTIVSISHETLIRQWYQLKKWLEQEARSAAIYRHLVQTARLWQQGKAALGRSPDLEQALEWKKQETPTEGWAKRYANDFDLAMKFLSASERRKTFKRRLFFMFISVGIIVTIGLAAWGFWERTQRIRAERRARVVKPMKGSVRVRQVILEDANGLIISPLNQRYLLKPREKITIRVGIDNPSDRKVKIEYHRFLEDKTGLDATYVAPNMFGNKDRVTIRVVDTLTEEILDQHVVNIKIVDTIE